MFLFKKWAVLVLAAMTLMFERRLLITIQNVKSLDEFWFVILHFWHFEYICEIRIPFSLLLTILSRGITCFILLVEAESCYNHPFNEFGTCLKPHEYGNCSLRPESCDQNSCRLFTLYRSVKYLKCCSYCIYLA